MASYYFLQKKEIRLEVDIHNRMVEYGYGAFENGSAGCLDQFLSQIC